MKLRTFDTETHLIQPGLAWPPLVVASTFDGERAELIPPEEVRERFIAIIREQIGGHNLPYDFGVICAKWPELIDLVFEALEEGRAIDSKVLEMLHDNAMGYLGHEPGQPDTPRSYSLGAVTLRLLGIDRSADKDDSNPDAWRYKYATLEGKPIPEWPEAARQYPLDDAEGNYRVLERQFQGPREVPGTHDFMGSEKPQRCIFCGIADDGGFELMGANCDKAPRRTIPGRQNVQLYADEMRADWFLALASGWGMRSDPQLTPIVTGEIIRKHEESRRRFIDCGIVRIRKCNKKKDKKTGISKLEDADEIPLLLVTDSIRDLQAKPPEDWIPGRIAELHKMAAAVSAGVPVRFAVDKGRLQYLVEQAYLGDPPMTDGGKSGKPQVSCNRDTLTESGDDLLEAYGESGVNEKLFTTFVKVLNQGTQVPINPQANVMVATDRTSYREPNLQQLPQQGLIRECFEPRGYIHIEVPACS